MQFTTNLCLHIVCGPCRVQRIVVTVMRMYRLLSRGGFSLVRRLYNQPLSIQSAFMHGRYVCMYFTYNVYKRRLILFPNVQCVWLDFIMFSQIVG